MNEEEELREEDSAINQWIRMVQQTQEKNSGVTDIIPRVLKYIALFEKRPSDEEVNLRDCYMALSDMTNGMVSKNLDPTTNQFFFENLSKLALKIKNSNNGSKVKFIRDLDQLNKQIIKTYNRKKSQKINVTLNPLKIPDELLKMTE